MRTVIQRVSRAEVRVEGAPVGRIDRGLLVLAGFAPGDSDDQLGWMAEKLVSLRIFPDDDGRMNRDVREVGGALLVVSQFTLYGDARRGRRPSFVGAAPPGEARALYGRFVERCRATGVEVETGEFGAMMDVDLVNAGPVTLVLER